MDIDLKLFKTINLYNQNALAETNNQIPDTLKSALQSHLGTSTKVQRAINFINYQKKVGDAAASEANGIFAPYKDAPDEEYEVVDMDMDTYEALQKIYIESVNVDYQDKLKIAREMGWTQPTEQGGEKISDDFVLNKYTLKDHYYAIAEAIFEDFTADRNRVLKMAKINKAAFFFASGQR